MPRSGRKKTPMKQPENWQVLLQQVLRVLSLFGAALTYIAFLVLVIIACSILPGCTSSTMPLTVPPELLKPCPNLTPLDDTTAGAVVWKVVEVAGLYYECQARLDALIDAVSARP